MWLIFIILIVVISIFGLSNLFLIPLPFFGKKGTEIGIVSEIRQVKNMKVVLLHGRTNEGLVIGRPNSYIWFRNWQKKPGVSEWIKVETLHYHFRFRNEKLCFALSWKYLDAAIVKRKTRIPHYKLAPSH